MKTCRDQLFNSVKKGGKEKRVSSLLQRMIDFHILPWKWKCTRSIHAKVICCINQEQHSLSSLCNFLVMSCFSLKDSLYVVTESFITSGPMIVILNIKHLKRWTLQHWCLVCSYPVVTLYPGGMAMHFLLALSQPQYGSRERMHSLQVSP